MAQKSTATATGRIEAEPAAVWRVLTDPELLSQAFFGAKVETDWRVGSPITFTGEWNGKSFQDKGEIVTVEPDRTLGFTHYSPLSGQPDVPGNYHTVTFELHPRDGGTELSIHQTNAGSEEEREHSAANWARVVESVRQLAER
ncbi:ATPase [Micromonospora globispora]|uniref:ATPase n=1 Tax=Micromonospora globispora TaxID=1450148 RepID=A0A317JTH9_9ACTN|nr:SRPBCC domain-containing protein [Micromonospora globispora]PWU44127.1 ATPase [Micromonospora globispora]RQX08272.1 ATPase [Micromonospora globispora]